jgi:hypothetical protein
MDMTDPVSGISGTKETSPGGTYSGGSFADEHKKKKSHVPEEDLVEISQDARDRSVGKKNKGIIEYLKELLG